MHIAKRAVVELLLVGLLFLGAAALLPRIPGAFWACCYSSAKAAAR